MLNSWGQVDLTDLQNQPDGSLIYDFELPGLLHQVSTSRSICCDVLYRKTEYRMYSRITRVCSTKFSSMNRGVGLYASNSCLTLTKHDRPDGHAVKMRMPLSSHKDKSKNKYIV